jgi:DNA-binding MarR family transcriptional regulator
MSTGTDGLRPTGRRFGLLRVAWDQALGAVLARVAPSHPELRPAHLYLFRFDGVDGATTAELAEHAGMTKQSMHELVTHLERLGYLTRQSDSGSARTRPLRLTATGRALQGAVHLAIADVLDEWRDRLGDERFDQLWRILQEVTGDHGDLPDVAEIRRRAKSIPPTAPRSTDDTGRRRAPHSTHDRPHRAR